MDFIINNIRTAFVCVNYNNSNFTKEYLLSCLRLKKNENIKIIIVDNNSAEDDFSNLDNFITQLNDERLVLIQNTKNVGYFSGLNLGLEYLSSTIYDYIVIGNNDLIFDCNFLEYLHNKEFAQETLVIAPDIIRPDGIHQNPHMLRPYSKMKIIYKKIYFSSYPLAYIFQSLVNMVKKYKRFNSDYYPIEGPIFMGYGACYILTRKYQSECRILDSNLFLMGEEGALSNQVKLAGGVVYYYPNLKVVHNDHSSIGKLPSRYLFNQNKIAFYYYLNECRALHSSC